MLQFNYKNVHNYHRIYKHFTLILRKLSLVYDCQMSGLPDVFSVLSAGTRVVLGRETSPIPNTGKLPQDILAKYSGKSKEVSVMFKYLAALFP